MNWIKVDQDIFDHVERPVSRTDTAIYGRTTFEMMESYWPTAADKPDDASKTRYKHSKWYKKVLEFVISNTLSGEV